jgi:SAM-dependent methyltransferase
MQRFWDERARENALYFVDNRLDYADPDAERFWAQGERDLEHMFELLEIEVRPGDVVADIGCGVGRLTRALSSRAGTVIGVDVSEEMLAQAREQNAHLTNVRWVHGDGTSLAPLEDAAVDACISLVVFQHIPDPRVTLGYVREMGRVLRPGGWAAFQVSTDPSVHRPRRRPPGERMRTLLGRAPRGQNDPRWRGSTIDLDALGRAAADGGMRVERVENPGQQFCIVLTRREPA